jgi:glycosyltransferase involved in cell wall biosynthesis
VIDPMCPDYANTPVSALRPRYPYALAEATAPPYVTIVTPFYNTGTLFHDTARSVLQQSFQQWEWLIINDGSTDPDALAILAGYRHSDPRIQIIDHDTNQGLSAARNTGFQRARTPYVVQLDSDDLLEPTAVEKWYWCLESYPEYAFVKGYSVGFGAREYLWDHGFHEGAAFLEANLVNATSMIRASVHQHVGGYDASNRAGCEDWEFWLRCASLGYWGSTMPEYLDWYRRRPTHSDRWQNLEQETERAFQTRLRQRYPQLWDGAFPQLHVRPHRSEAPLTHTAPCANLLHKTRPRLLLLAPWLTLGGVDKFNLDMLDQLSRQGWDVTVVATALGDQAWLPLFAHLTPDTFILPHFLRLVDYPRFLRYLIQSRQVDVVMVAHSEMGYRLLPYLRAECPDATFVDFCHIEDEEWKHGGYPRLAVEYQALLDLNLVTSNHLARWMQQAGAEAQRLRVCYINVDVTTWCPAPTQRGPVRQELGIDTTLPMVLYVGRLCAQKQPQVFAHTVLRLAQLGVRFVGVVAGEGPELEWLQTFIAQQGLDAQVRVLGAVSNARIRALMTTADVLFLPSQWEGIALVLYEAMACGLPIVGADVGGQCELVTPDCGILVQRSTAEAETACYTHILAELLTQPQRRQAMGQASRARVVADFRSEQMGERLVTLLAEAQRWHRSQPRPVPGSALAELCAVQAIEYMRLCHETEQVWHERLEWQRTAETWERVTQEQEQVVQEQRAWIAELERGKAWLEEQRVNWQRTAETCEMVIQEHKAWITELEQSKAWLEERWAVWQQQAWIRLGWRLRLLPPSQVSPQGGKGNMHD